MTMKSLDIEKLMKQLDGYSVEEVAEALLDYAADQEKEKKLNEAFLAAARAVWTYLSLLDGTEAPEVDDETLLGFKELVDEILTHEHETKPDKNSFDFFFKSLGL